MIFRLNLPFDNLVKNILFIEQLKKWQQYELQIFHI